MNKGTTRLFGLDCYFESIRSPHTITHPHTQASFAQQEQFIVLAQEEPEIWHKPFQAVAYRKVVGTLTQASLFLSMLMRASAAFPSELSPKDRAMHAAIQGAVADLKHVREVAYE